MTKKEKTEALLFQCELDIKEMQHGRNNLRLKGFSEHSIKSVQKQITEQIRERDKLRDKLIRIELQGR